MNVGLFIPCYVDQFYPQVGIATLRLLESLGVTVTFPMEQTCCGQPMANSGFQRLSAGCDKNFIQNFANCDVVVGPSGSCVLHLKDHLHSDERPDEAARLRANVYELCEFLTDVLKVESLPNARFPHRVGLHTSCHGQRGLGLSSMSELVAPTFSKPEQLLRMVDGLELIELTHPDECCGFGGTFCVFEEALSSKMGKDRVADHLRHGAEVITGGDMSCLMQLEGVLRRQNSSVKIKHIAEILAS
ncbi:(Fe-S)-binding protein [Spirosoma sp. SC4-14]|uniref:(Fe-S)-binding protein n=1 Tax=Spirosoma sp. SC4-14 TaxID=3128900 RepID=UPI0030CCB0B7